MQRIGALFFIVFLSVLFCRAQTREDISFTSAAFTRPGSSHFQPTAGYQFQFRFLGDNTDVRGLVNASSSLNITEINSNCCFYGKRFVVSDYNEGINPFVQGADAVVVNGTGYSSFFYRGAIRFIGSALVPMYIRKKTVQIIKVPITMTGYIKGYATLADRNQDINALFNLQLSTLGGTAAYTIRPHDLPGPGMENHFDIVNVSYAVAPQ